jgi:hypothetical protein
LVQAKRIRIYATVARAWSQPWKRRLNDAFP